MIKNLWSRNLAACALGLGAFLWAASAWAHHSISGKFNTTAAKTTLVGNVTSVDWRNPHVHIFMNVRTPGQGKAGAQTLNWAVELESPSLLEMEGHTRNTLQPGAAITVVGSRARDNSRQVWGESVTFTGDKNLVFPPKVVLPKNSSVSRPAPTWPDGQVALGQAPGTSDGFWGAPSETVLMEDGVTVATDQYGLLTNLADASKVAPMQPWALGVYQFRQSRQLKDDPTYINCKPPGGPRMFQSPLGIQLVEDRERKRIFVLMGSGNHNYRIIYMDGRKQVGLQGGDDDNPLYFGRSVGKWEGKTLVVDTIGYNEDFWFTNGGLPHTDKLHLVERYTRSDYDTLRYEVQVDDIGAYTRNWTASWTMKWNGGGSLPSHFCQNNRQ